MPESSHPIPVIFEDNHVLVVIKPQNVPTQEDASRDPDMVSLLKTYLREKYNKPGEAFLGLVHRLDRPVGGIMVFAKTSKGASRLSDTIRTRNFHKTYLAVVRGAPPQPQAKLMHYLLKNNETNTVSVVAKHIKEAKEAVLHYTLLGTHEGLSLVSIQLETGRPHQIRVQMAEIGCPLYGDQKYGASVNKPGEQIALWAYQLAFPHPTLKQMLEFQSNPPAEYPWILWDLQSR